ncbi:Crp/Fnr family transcriptional regulator [Sphingomonas japonica]|uniref:CRP-like cAMP-binding protein n=1 Tax=Sphingomonas japonica TaxID=511662 RepID=A0ABX0TYT9_9SPHN|nr:Crp/Fnr family transcriptional regulator [Sphingomonas japonica]NIJ22671.1 CRP-like cAMP-binding protein [Sphingomonas japonica]
MPDTQYSTANVLVRSLAADDWRSLNPHLTRIMVQPGAVLCEQHADIDTVYFPETAVTSLSERHGDTAAEIAMIGCDGLVGWPVVLGSSTAFHRVVVRLDGGTALACPAARLIRLCASSDTLAATLLRYVQTVTRQLSRSIVANLSAPVEARLARWLLMLHDRTPGDTLSITHQELAGFLGVRRASVTDCLHILEGERMLRCTRGRIDILDRGPLQDRAGDTYGVAEDAYRELIGPFGKSRHSAVRPAAQLRSAFIGA